MNPTGIGELLDQLKRELLKELKILIQGKQPQHKKWLKSHEVLRMLAISPNKLKDLRDSGALPYTQLGGVLFYNYDDIQTMLQSHKIRRQAKKLN